MQYSRISEQIILSSNKPSTMELHAQSYIRRVEVYNIGMRQGPRKYRQVCILSPFLFITVIERVHENC